MIVLSSLVTKFQKRAAYRRTYRALQSMPLDVALDLGMYREDAAKTAAKSVYG